MRRAALKIMKRYMEDIYGLTTINHDHIFASLLKHSVRDIVDKDNFRRRAFLAIVRGVKQLPVHTHQSFTASQSHLLIDDRFGKLADFLKVAEDKKVIETNGSWFRRNRSTMRNFFDYDRVRIDNPVAVIAQRGGTAHRPAESDFPSVLAAGVHPAPKNCSLLPAACAIGIRGRLLRELQRRGIQTAPYRQAFASARPLPQARHCIVPRIYGRSRGSAYPGGLSGISGLLGLHAAAQRAWHLTRGSGALQLPGLDSFHGRRLYHHAPSLPSGSPRRLFHRRRPGAGTGRPPEQRLPGFFAVSTPPAAAVSLLQVRSPGGYLE